MTQVIVHGARAGKEFGSIELTSFCDRDPCEAAILVSKDDAYFIHSLLQDIEVVPSTPAQIFTALVGHIGGRFSEVGVGPKTGSMRITLMSGAPVHFLAHPGFILQVALLADLPIFYGEEDDEKESTKEEVNVDNVRERLLAAMTKKKA